MCLRPPEILGMPLHAHKRLRRVTRLHRLDGPVESTGNDPQPLPDLRHRLVMSTVHHEHAVATQEAGQQRPIFHAHFVHRRVQELFGATMLQRGPRVPPQVLDESPTAGDVEKLAASADPQHRKLLPDCAAQEIQFVLVPLEVDTQQRCVQWVATIEKRGDISTSGQNQTVCLGHDLWDRQCRDR